MRKGVSPSIAHSSLAEAIRRFPAVWRALFEHASLPWCGPAVADRHLTPLDQLPDTGSRHALSIVAQYAAHLAFLKFASIIEGEFDASDWAVVRERSKDVRLVRVAPPRTSGRSDALELLRRCAAQIHADGLDTLTQPWIRPEAAYREIYRTLEDDVAADRRWLLDGASGCVRSPGPEVFEEIANRGGCVVMSSDAAALEIARATVSAALVLGTNASPLKRYSAFDPAGLSGDSPEGMVAERFVAGAGSAPAIALVNCGSIDSSSWRAIALAAELLPAAIWFVGPTRGELPFRNIVKAAPDRWFVLSPTVRSAADAERILGEATPDSVRAWCTSFTHSRKFTTYLDEGILPDHLPRSITDAIPEPRRSYLSALALLGAKFERSIADRFLEQLGCALSLDEVCGDAAEIGDDVVFREASLRVALADSIEKPMRSALARLAAETMGEEGDRIACAVLLAESGGEDAALRAIESELAKTPAVVEQIVSEFPIAFLCQSPSIAAAVSRELLRRGRYRRAREAALSAASPEREILVATVHRRRGEYREALIELDRVRDAAGNFESELLRAELLRLENRSSEASSVLDELWRRNESPAVQARIDYERALIAIDDGANIDASLYASVQAVPYLAARLATYRALAADDFETARESAECAVALAQSAGEKIDASLDRFYADFMSGRWESARHQALVTLAEVEETDGDRAAVGVLYTLSYLYADSGQFQQSRVFVDRMRQFFAHSGDDRRERELALVTAQQELSAMRLDEADADARALLDAADVPKTIRDAAALIVDEVATLRGCTTLPRSCADSKCVELRDRFLLLQAIVDDTRESSGGMADGYTRDLARWVEASRRDPSAAHPEPAGESAALRLYRVASALHARRRSDSVRNLVQQLSSRFPAVPDAIRERAVDGSPALVALCDLAARPFPPDERPLGRLEWCYASRNRLGRWSRYGSATGFTDDELDEMVASPHGDWAACGERGVLFLEGSATWPADVRQVVTRSCEMRFENMRLKRAIDQENDSVAEAVPMNHGWIGESASVVALQATIAKVAQRDVAVCIIGESGTGKELAARAIHRSSSRRARPFTPINCAALPENLVESELFGHVKGAFTGADRDRAGLIEATDGGTLFLDEIGEMPMPAQAKLLRFLQEKEFRRVGESAIRHADVRVVAATNRKLEQAVDAGTFREDLYYRLRGIELVVPPLRERGGDILLIARHFLEREREQHRRGAARFSEEVEQAMLSYEWPGNVRELENTVRAGHALAGDVREIALEHLPERVRSAPRHRHAAGTYFDEVSRFRRSLIERSLIDAKGNQNRAASLLGMSRQALGYQIRELGIVVGTKRK